MALGTTAQGEVRSTGNDLNGGFFNSAFGGTDYSQQDDPVLILTDASTTAGQQNITSASGLFSAALLGNTLQLNGTIYEIILFTNSTTIRLDRAVGATATNQTVRVGGALATPGKAASLGSAGPSTGTVWVKYAEYVTSTTTVNVSGGPVSLNNFSLSFQGYDVTRGDRARKPVFKPHAASLSLWVQGGVTSVSQFINLAADGNSQTGVTGFSASNRGLIMECDASNCNVGFAGYTTRCFAKSCALGFSGSTGFQNVALSCSNGFTGISSPYCIAHSCTTGFTFTQNIVGSAVGCLAYNCTNGFINSGAIPKMWNCLSAKSTTKGYSNTTLNTHTAVLGFGSWQDAANDITPTVACTADPFANSSATINSVSDAFTAFALNNATGGGAALRAINAGVFGYSDIGPVQHQDAGGSSSASSLFGSSIICAGGRTT